MSFFLLFFPRATVLFFFVQNSPLPCKLLTLILPPHYQNQTDRHTQRPLFCFQYTNNNLTQRDKKKSRIHTCTSDRTPMNVTPPLPLSPSFPSSLPKPFSFESWSPVLLLLNDEPPEKSFSLYGPDPREASWNMTKKIWKGKALLHRPYSIVVFVPFHDTLPHPPKKRHAHTRRQSARNLHSSSLCDKRIISRPNSRRTTRQEIPSMKFSRLLLQLPLEATQPPRCPPPFFHS